MSTKDEPKLPLREVAQAGESMPVEEVLRKKANKEEFPPELTEPARPFAASFAKADKSFSKLAKKSGNDIPLFQKVAELAQHLFSTPGLAGFSIVYSEISGKPGISITENARSVAEIKGERDVDTAYNKFAASFYSFIASSTHQKILDAINSCPVSIQILKTGFITPSIR